MDILRPFWRQRLEDAWKQKPIIWLAGVRRTGKTTLVQSLPDATYVNCDLPRIQAELEDPEIFYKTIKTKYVIFDEIHQLENASQVLKIGADEFKKIKILATGSSTLVASKKFKDTLTGRKINIHFLPVLIEELEAFNQISLSERIRKGGLPPALLSAHLLAEFYGEWLDSFYARDVQEIFNIEKRQPFLKVLEFLLVQNGNLLEVTELAKFAGISRPTAVKYLDVLEVTKAITIVRPFSGNKSQEIISQPRVYAFDTGFCFYVQGHTELRSEDCGTFLENLTLESYQASGLLYPIHFWRTKQTQKEVDFVVPISKKNLLCIECKWKKKSFSPDAILNFRTNYPEGLNWVIVSDSEKISVQKIKNTEFVFIPIQLLRSEFTKL